MEKRQTLSLIVAMLVFGSIGVFRRLIPLPSAFIAFTRGIIGALFLLAFILVKYRSLNFKAIRKNIVILALCGTFIGINWVLLFEAFNYTDVSIATMCYYVSPIFVLIGSLIFYGERLTVKKGACALVSLFGMVLVSGILEGEIKSEDILGILLALGASVFYAAVTLLSKKLDGVSRYETGFVELLFAGVIVLPYSLSFEEIALGALEIVDVFLLLLVGILHTGIAYALFFGATSALPSSKVALFSYIDPASALLFSFIILSERLSPLSTLGAIAILLSAIASDLSFKKSGKQIKE
jgi:RarD protein